MKDHTSSAAPDFGRQFDDWKEQNAKQDVISDVIRESERRIMDYEADLAKKKVQDEFKAATGVFPPIAAGYWVYVRLHQSNPEKPIINDKGEKVILLTKSLKAVSDEKYHACVGLVIDVGPQAYTGNNYDGTPRFPHGPWCRVGDWVIIPRQEGAQVSYGATREQMIPLMIIADDKIYGITPDPNFVIATHMLDQDGR